MGENIDNKSGNTKLQQVKQFCYFGSTIKKNNCYTAKIKTRITLSKQAFQKMSNVLINKHLSGVIYIEFKARIFVSC